MIVCGATEVCPKERQVDRIRRIIGTALRQAEHTQTARIPAEAVPRLPALIAKSTDPGDEVEDQGEDDGALFGAAEAAAVTAPTWRSKPTSWEDVLSDADQRLDLTDLPTA